MAKFKYLAPTGEILKTRKDVISFMSRSGVYSEKDIENVLSEKMVEKGIISAVPKIDNADNESNETAPQSRSGEETELVNVNDSTTKVTSERVQENYTASGNRSGGERSSVDEDM